MNKFVSKILMAVVALSLFAVLQWQRPLKLEQSWQLPALASFLGGPEARTIEMLAEEINAQGGVNGNKIELIIKGFRCKP